MTIETANRLYELRKKQGLSQEELAEKLGVSRQAVSKWERSEASPDTDNLIALAKIYDITLDELIYGEKKEKNTITEEDPVENTEDTKGESEDFENIEIKPGKIFVESKDGDKVKIDISGININSKNGDKVKIGLNGIKIEADEDDDDDDDDDDNWESIEQKNKYKSSFWHNVPYPILCVIAYLLFGCFDICGGWGLSWIIFMTIPLYYSIVKAIYIGRFSMFAYPVFTAFAYLYIGLYHHNWHPSWIIFITIPVYYCIANAIDKIIKEKKQNRAN